MSRVILPDDNTLEMPDGSTVADVAARIGSRLSRDAIAGKINGEIVDLTFPLPQTCRIEILTPRVDNPDSLHVIRHSAAHVMAEAICSIWPATKLVYGPPIDNGFYYDIDLDTPIKPEHFPEIEARMNEIIKADRPFTRYCIDRSEGMDKLRAEGNPYKIDNAERADGELSFYVTGTEKGKAFEDLCRGPHVPSTGRIGAVKVMQVSGAYYRGDQNAKQLQRVYGTAWPTAKDLKKYLDQLEEARKRDHRKIGEELGLFKIDPMVGSGLVLWKPKGSVIRYELENYIRNELIKNGYQMVYTPHIGKLSLYRTSGHFPYYKDSQFPPLYESKAAEKLNDLWEAATARGDAEGLSADERRLIAEIESVDPAMGQKLAERKIEAAAGMKTRNQQMIGELLSENDGYLLKPMNCPHHIRIYASEPRSYRDLPIRLAEFGTVYRNEASGELSGMARVRGFTQDDAHIFCRPDQLLAEITGCVNLVRGVLDLLKLSDFRVRVSLRDPGSNKYVGSEENWNLAEQAVREAVRQSGMKYTEEIGEAAFYGPKIDFVVKDCLEREWQLGTVQVDYNLPERFDLTYAGADNNQHRPVMIHRAPFGAFERFVAILIEHFAGAFPLWLAPIQVYVASISEKSAEYAGQVYNRLLAGGVRTILDVSPRKIGPKKHDARKQQVPYILVVGEKEAADGTVNVNDRAGNALGTVPIEAFLARCKEEIDSRVIGGN